MKRAIDSARCRRLYNQRMGRVETVFGNIRHEKRLARLKQRGRDMGSTSGQHAVLPVLQVAQR
jgi:hypothetical protein